MLRYEHKAKENGTILVSLCGFDSIPADIGTFFMASEVRKRYSSGLAEVQAFMVGKGSVSGGTIASGLTMAGAPGSSRMNDPLFLVPKEAVSSVVGSSPYLTGTTRIEIIDLPCFALGGLGKPCETSPGVASAILHSSARLFASTLGHSPTPEPQVGLKYPAGTV